MRTDLTLGKYELIEELGSGGYGVVYQARDTNLHRAVALKLLHPRLTADPGFVQQFYQEAQLVAQLDHPNVVTVYDVGEEEGQHFIVMQYVEGRSLAEGLTRGESWPPERILPLAEQLAAALDYAHAQGVLHLDVKPGNVLLGDEDQVWLTDFGLGRAVSSATQPSSALAGGTPAYLAPEQADLEEPRPVTAAADIYGFGVVLYRLCTGRVPFEGKPTAVTTAHVNQQPPRPTLLNDALSQAVEDVLLRALAKSPQARFPEAAGLVDALAEAARKGKGRSRTTRVVTAEPLKLGDFRVRTLRKLAQACDNAWEKAVERFFDGTLEAWLQEARILGAAEEAKRLREEWAEAEGRERERGLEEFLEWTGYVTDPVLRMTPETLDFGAEEKGYGYRLRALLTVQNVDRGLVWGEVSPLVQWITVVEGARFWVRPGERREVLVEAELDALPSGRTERRDALTVRTQVSEEQVGVRVEVRGPEVYLESDEIDFGEVAEDEEPTRSLTVANRGHGALMGTAHADVSWLEIIPEHFRCTAGRRQTLRVRVDPARLPTTVRRELETSLILETNEGVYSIEVRLVHPDPIHLLEPEMVHVPAGPFTMGSDEMDDAPEHTVDLPEYRIGKYPITNAEYACFIRTTDHAAPKNWQEDTPPAGRENYPVVNVSWHDAVAYCRWLSNMTGKPYRLPTEAEWEKAACGTEGRTYPWGEDWVDGEYCNTEEAGIGKTTPVDQYLQGASPYGAMDMAGNVWEWCSSLYKIYPYRRDDGREDRDAAGKHVLRGGSWRVVRYWARCACRHGSRPDYHYDNIGFRCCAAATSSL